MLQQSRHGRPYPTPAAARVTFLRRSAQPPPDVCRAAQMTSGAYFGEISLVFPVKRTATARAGRPPPRCRRPPRQHEPTRTPGSMRACKCHLELARLPVRPLDKEKRARQTTAVGTARRWESSMAHERLGLWCMWQQLSATCTSSCARTSKSCSHATRWRPSRSQRSHACARCTQAFCSSFAPSWNV